MMLLTKTTFILTTSVTLNIGYDFVKHKKRSYVRTITNVNIVQGVKNECVSTPQSSSSARCYTASPIQPSVNIASHRTSFSLNFMSKLAS